MVTSPVTWPATGGFPQVVSRVVVGAPQVVSVGVTVRWVVARSVPVRAVAVRVRQASVRRIRRFTLCPFVVAGWKR